MDVRPWMTKTVTRRAQLSVTAYGDPVYAAPDTLQARIESSTEIVQQADGSELRAAHALFTTTPVALTDRLWLPGTDTADNAQGRIPLKVAADESKGGDFILYTVLLP